MVFFCEGAVGFGNDVGLQDEGHFDALVRMFGEASRVIGTSPEGHGSTFLDRLDAVRRLGRNLAYGVADEMDDRLRHR